MNTLQSVKFDSPKTRRSGQPTRQQLAERQLRSKPYIALLNISCDYHEGVLVLRGRLPSYYLKQVAQEAVKDFQGPDGIDNQIQVVAADGSGVI